MHRKQITRAIKYLVKFNPRPLWKETFQTFRSGITKRGDNFHQIQKCTLHVTEPETLQTANRILMYAKPPTYCVGRKTEVEGKERKNPQGKQATTGNV